MTTIHQHDDEKVMTETTVQILRNDRWDTIGNDFAEEYRGVGMVNKTSALENCITSSIGRALSACGLSGGNYASFEEVDHAMNEKAESKPKKKVFQATVPKIGSSANLAKFLVPTMMGGSRSV